MKIKSKCLITYCGALLLTGQASAAVTLLDTDFDSGSLSPWTVNVFALTGLYQHNTLLQPAGTTNYATSGDYAVSLNKGGGTMTTGSFDLTAGTAAESITIELAAEWLNGTTTRRTYLEMSLDGGTNWFWLATLQATNGTGSLTLTEGSSTVSRSGIMLTNNPSGTAWNGSAFTDDMVFRYRNLSSAGADVRIFIDDTVITSTIPAPVPEPSSALLGGLGLLAMLRRRRG